MESTGIDSVWEMIESYENSTKINGFFDSHREKQSVEWMHESLKSRILRDFYNSAKVKAQLEELEAKVRANKISPKNAANSILNKKD